MPDENEISHSLIGIFIDVHKELGPGLLESVYEEAVVYELARKRIYFRRQVGIPASYGGRDLGIGFRADLIVADKVIVEIKSIEAIVPVHHKQILTYLKLSGIKLGLLVNFNVLMIKSGISRVVNNL